MNGDRLLFSVAVGGAGSKHPLPGTYTVAESMKAWGQAAGFESFLVSDQAKSNAVTCARLREFFLEHLFDRPQGIDHLIFHFAGHGFIKDSQTLLLLTDWSKNGDEAIHLQQFQILLRRYRPARVTYIIDACQEYESAATAGVNGSGILDKGPYDPEPPHSDSFFATVAGRPAYMLRGSKNESPVCLFSAVILRSLAGLTEPRHTPGVVRSWDIHGYLTGQLDDIAAGYNVTQIAQPSCGFPPADDLY